MYSIPDTSKLQHKLSIHESSTIGWSGLALPRHTPRTTEFRAGGGPGRGDPPWAPPAPQQPRGGALTSSTAIVLGSAICLWLLLFGLIGSLYFHLHSSTNSFKEELRPKLQEALAHASSVLAHLDRAATNADHILHEADTLERQAVPGILNTINDTSNMLHRLESMSHNPVLKLSLG